MNCSLGPFLAYSHSAIFFDFLEKLRGIAPSLGLAASDLGLNMLDGPAGST